MFYVEVYRKDNNEVVKRMGPMSESKADRVENGLIINLNWAEFSTRITGENIDV